ncbi:MULTISPECIES: hypothetical protein [unclassified Paenibacillus]|uniref:hypothetical protein n=1 Tax=unclassified Paenibacillus TaxID=185978 RepID=UPI00122E257C|nr:MULTISPECIES: hypothetical protein [unclassified Paenibacillus]MBD8840063.1 hypothetical protein [Paenibacillus sp. CFBP 13594]
MKINQEIIKMLSNIEWFSKCGMRDYQSNTILYTNSWVEASEYCDSQEWEETTLKTRNQLTSYLHNHFSKEYLDWNALVKEAKTISDEILNEQLNKTRNAFQLDDMFGECVRWDILNIIMEYSYLNELGNNRNKFYSDHLLYIYSIGHYPCGWEGTWPSGKLVIF